MGLSQSTFVVGAVDGQQQQQQNLPSLSEALGGGGGEENNNIVVNWDIVRQILIEEPSQACMYAHGGVEDSMLYTAITRNAPLDVVVQLVDSYDDALDHRSSNGGGATVLHAAARINSDIIDPEVVSYLLKVKPALAKEVDLSGGCLALHYCRNVESIKHILKVYPEGIVHRSQKCGNIPLHSFLLHEEGEEVGNNNNYTKLLKLLSGGGCTTQLLTKRNKRGQTPLQLLINKVEQRAEAAASAAAATSSSSNGNDDDNDVNEDLEEINNDPDMNEDNGNDDELWNVLLEWVRALASSSTSTKQQQQQQMLELHSLIEYGCCNTELLMKRALNHYGEQASMRDSRGRTPLHVAAAGGGGLLCSSKSSTTTTPESIEALLKYNPKAPRMTDNEGRLPIDIAAESPNIRIQALAVLMKGEPRAIDTRDLRDGNYPFVSAALSGQQTSINNTYFLLRAKPHVLSYFHLP